MHRRNFLAGTTITGAVLFGGCLATATASEPTKEENMSDGKGDDEDDGNRRENEDESGEEVPYQKELTAEKVYPDCNPRSSEYPEATSDLDEYSPVGTYEGIEIGNREGVEDSRRPHGIDIWNAGATPEVSLRVIDTIDDAVVHDQTYAIPEDHELSISLS